VSFQQVWKRLAAIIPVLLGISFVVFGMIRAAPGGPFDTARAAVSEEARDALRARYHLDEPVWKQYGRFLAQLVKGDLGPSLKYRHHTVNDVLSQALPVSMMLGVMAFLFALALGIPLGVAAAVGRGRASGCLAESAILLCISIPALLLGPLLVLVFAVGLGWFPVGLWNSPWHAVLPVATLGIFFAGRVARLMREGMMDAFGSSFVTAARARGVGEGSLIWRHALPIGATPVVSYAGPLLADLLTGSFVVENVFQIPGIGVFMVNSALNRDYTMVVGLVLVYAVLLLMLNLVVDVAYTVLDPKVRHG